eukprot:8555701-Pyramimonas_sp.AAC.1
MVRLPSHALTRVWAKARRWLSAEQPLHNCDEMRGTRGSHTSTASAFAHNLEQEVGSLIGNHICTIFLDMAKCFDMVSPHALMREARELGYPMRLLWMLLQLCQQPRRIK